MSWIIAVSFWIYSEHCIIKQYIRLLSKINSFKNNSFMRSFTCWLVLTLWKFSFLFLTSFWIARSLIITFRIHFKQASINCLYNATCYKYPAVSLRPLWIFIGIVKIVLHYSIFSISFNISSRVIRRLIAHTAYSITLFHQHGDTVSVCANKFPNVRAHTGRVNYLDYLCPCWLSSYKRSYDVINK